MVVRVSWCRACLIRRSCSLSDRVASFLNGPEAFANYRRTGFPALAPNPYPGKEVAFIRRLTYPNSEQSVNQTNFNAAVTAQGPDKLDTRVWWDKP